MSEMRTTSTGFTERIDNFEGRIPDYDPRSGDHFWVITGAWRCDPAKSWGADGTLLDHESLVLINPPGCFHCEHLYTAQLASRRCKGHP